ncbi:MAG: DNA (cytosine-5-)-methyltransferase [Rhodospirillaceae bacterium]|jgi:DNA (cytosine-5)-methyltransferase 1|uniref:DNA cytosine methyltransferase n=1 Tax=Hwanghaeella sp. 1Z406 TaxID=3402811 RepID=UPI000C400669|nr:DNA (cytosine-5-)-methyltransferase [Rhodospirillales bacterium]MAX49199.1 DNA (cytosine-5-)-methyltransferase [Rhodospirillaceae bacterium]|tara:strand:- start:1498 stop:2808 length:1311 start_codon:yes stop_codon:yes gene_type:complete
MRRPKAVDLFAGAGGMSLGFEQAGYDIVAAVEIDPIHAATHKFNFPECAILPKSVSDVSGNEILRAADLSVGDVDLVFGGAPCQGFSLIGQRAMDDPRNRLVKDFVRLVAELGATYFVFENVKGLTLGKHRQFLDELISEFGDAGYSVRQPWKVLNSYNYGVPQDRFRLFLIGARFGVPLPEYPVPTTRSLKENSIHLPLVPNCWDALSDLEDADQFQELLDSDSVRLRSSRPISEYARELRCLSNDAWHFGHVREWDPNKLTSSARTIHTEISRGRFARTEPGTVEPISRFYKLSKSGVSNTLRAGTDSARGAFTSPRPIHYEYNRCVTVREMARLHGYPDWFRFHFTKWHGARQIGNSVPPPLARAVAREVLKASGNLPIRSSKQFFCQDESLLSMDMKQSSKYWGIDVPIANRNMKSGNRKRRQVDIENEKYF